MRVPGSECRVKMAAFDESAAAWAQAALHACTSLPFCFKIRRVRMLLYYVYMRKCLAKPSGHVSDVTSG